MSDLILAGILGVVEGITEFLPVSSTAHLRIAQYFLGVSLEDEFWKLFAVFIQLGAILSVVVLYRVRLATFFREAFTPKFYGHGLKGMLSHPVGLIGLAFVCTAIPAFLMKKIIGHNLESMNVMILALLVGGVVMMVVDYLFKRGATQSVETMKPWQAIFIGFVQVLSAVFPGTSRSMSTIAAGELAGLSRSTALDFSFLVSVPVMIVATLYDLYKYKKEVAGGISFSGHQLMLLSVGFVISFVVAYAVIAWFLGFVRRRGFMVFGLYRIALAILLLLVVRGQV